MVLRHHKSLKKLSSLFSNSTNGFKNLDSTASHLIWILLASANQPPQNEILYNSSIDRLVKAISTEKGVHTVTQLNNTSPVSSFSNSAAASPKASLTSLLVYINGEASFRAMLQKLRALLHYTEIAKDSAGHTILHWSLSTYTSIQLYEPRRSREVSGHCVVTVTIDPASGQDADVDAWYRKEHLAMLGTSPLFLRCRRYKRVLDPSTVDQSEGGVAGAEFLAVHDYTSVHDLFDHSLKKGQLIEETEWTRRVMGEAKAVDRTIWTVQGPGAAGLPS